MPTGSRGGTLLKTLLHTQPEEKRSTESLTVRIRRLYIYLLSAALCRTRKCRLTNMLIMQSAHCSLLLLFLYLWNIIMSCFIWCCLHFILWVMFHQWLLLVWVSIGALCIHLSDEVNEENWLNKTKVWIICSDSPGLFLLSHSLISILQTHPSMMCSLKTKMEPHSLWLNLRWVFVTELSVSWGEKRAFPNKLTSALFP